MLDSCQSPLPPRECDSMLLTMPSARRPCSTILARLPVSRSIVSCNSARLFSSGSASSASTACFSSSSSSLDRPAKLLTKFSGFLISCAMPAVSWPSEAIFSAWIRLAWAAFSRSSESRNSVNSRTFSMAITAWAAKVSSSSICRGVNAPGSALRSSTAADGHRPRASCGAASSGAEACAAAQARWLVANSTGSSDATSGK